MTTKAKDKAKEEKKEVKEDLVWVHYKGSEDYRTIEEVTWDKENPAHEVTQEVADYLLASSPNDFAIGDEPIAEESSEEPEGIAYTPVNASSSDDDAGSTDDPTET